MATPVDPGRQFELMVEANAAVESAALEVMERLAVGGDPNYPPNGGLTPPERTALAGLTADQRLALRKHFADAAACALFRLFSVMDAVGDPESYDDQLWLPMVLCDPTEAEAEHQEMLHDAFYDAYAEWRSRRGTRGWTLDLADD